MDYWGWTVFLLVELLIVLLWVEVILNVWMHTAILGLAHHDLVYKSLGLIFCVEGCHDRQDQFAHMTTPGSRKGICFFCSHSLLSSHPYSCGAEPTYFSFGILDTWTLFNCWLSSWWMAVECVVRCLKAQQRLRKCLDINTCPRLSWDFMHLLMVLELQRQNLGMTYRGLWLEDWNGEGRLVLCGWKSLSPALGGPEPWGHSSTVWIFFFWQLWVAAISSPHEAFPSVSPPSVWIDLLSLSWPWCSSVPEGCRPENREVSTEIVHCILPSAPTALVSSEAAGSASIFFLLFSGSLATCWALVLDSDLVTSAAAIGTATTAGEISLSKQGFFVKSVVLDKLNSPLFLSPPCCLRKLFPFGSGSLVSENALKYWD